MLAISNASMWRYKWTHINWCHRLGRIKYRSQRQGNVSSIPGFAESQGLSEVISHFPLFLSPFFVLPWVPFFLNFGFREFLNIWLKRIFKMKSRVGTWTACCGFHFFLSLICYQCNRTWSLCLFLSATRSHSCLFPSTPRLLALEAVEVVLAPRGCWDGMECIGRDDGEVEVGGTWWGDMGCGRREWGNEWWQVQDELSCPSAYRKRMEKITLINAVALE